jgi:hypothetical protein
MKEDRRNRQVIDGTSDASGSFMYFRFPDGILLSPSTWRNWNSFCIIQ